MKSSDQSQAGKFGGRRGMAVVIVLAFVVLACLLVVVFLTRTTTERQVSNSSANITKCDLLARSALDEIVGDLKQEIAAGSANPKSGVYLPTNNTTVVPERTTTSAAPNLVKVSARNTPFFSGTAYSGTYPPSDLASTASTANASLNGRLVSAERWNKSYLLPRNLKDPAPKGYAGTPDTVGTIPDPTLFQTPDWIIVTRRGSAKQTGIGSGNDALSNASSANQNYAIGRYAYMVFDEGGLLNVNVAGHPGAPEMDELYGRKGNLSFADLTQIGLTQSDIDHIVGWRNYATAKPDKDWGSYLFPLASASNYYNFVLSNTTGFLTVPSDTAKYPAFNGNTDHLFQSRQQLIQFRRGVNGPGTQGFSQDALQYLGTFSREKNAPSWSPQTPVTSGSDYAGNADQPGAANRNIVNVRFQGNTTLTRYRLDGTAYTKTMKAGDPVVFARFPLGRLAWLTPNGPAAGIPPEAIKAHFGLVWSPTDLCWNYTSPTGAGSPASVIKTLEQIKQEGREADFFELLRAGILEGSLGKTASDPRLAPAAGNPPNDTTWARTAQNDVNIDMQVLQIGANIIDQYDTDSISTDIRFVNSQLTPAATVDLFGVESLPYIDWIPYVCHRPEQYPNHDMIGAWFTFEMWDPHQNATTVSSAPGAPTSFRIRPMQGNAQFQVQASGNISPASVAAYQSFLTNQQGYKYPAFVDLNTKSYINFTRSGGGAPDFSEPTMLQPGFATTTSTNDLCTISAPATTQQGSPGFVGFNFGLWNLPELNLHGGASGSSGFLNLTIIRYSIQASSTSWPSFEVQAQDPSTGTWRTYQRFINMRGTDPGGSVPSGNVSFQYLGTQIGMYNADPRTERFGAFGGHGLSTTQWLLDQHVWPGTNAASSLSGFMGWAQPGWQSNGAGYKDFKLQLLSYNNNTFKSVGGWVCYTDPDQVLRQGDSSLGTYPMYWPASDHMQDRPLMLNRPFRTVAELGYADRDMPWKTLDFFTKDSADSALLDLFTTSDVDVDVTAGRVNLNTRNAPVLQAILANAITAELSGTQSALTDAQAKAIASGMVNWTSLSDGSHTLLNRSDLVPMLADASLGLSGTLMNIKTQREVAVRALGEVGMTRTWNLLIDVIAQSGKYPNNAKSLDDFTVEGERRYWLHIAIDRFTGEIVDQQLESLYE